MRALYGKGTCLKLTSKKISELPACVFRLTNLSVLLLNNNFIAALPAELLSLQHVSFLTLTLSLFAHFNANFHLAPQMCYTAHRFVIKYFSLCDVCKLAELNLGNNALKEVPAVLGHLESLKKLYLFSNQITAVPPEVIGRLTLLCMISILKNNIKLKWSLLL